MKKSKSPVRPNVKQGVKGNGPVSNFNIINKKGKAPARPGTRTVKSNAGLNVC